MIAVYKMLHNEVYIIDLERKGYARYVTLDFQYGHAREL